MRLYLTGFMGAGKTTVGRLLAARLELPFVDLDGEIEAAAGRRVAEIFAGDGEAAFRRLERRALHGTAALERSVVATGGGTPIDPENRAWMRRHGRILWLDVPLERLRERVGSDPRRPLWGDPEALERLYRERLDVYRDCDLRVDASGTAAEVGEILAAIL